MLLTHVPTSPSTITRIELRSDLRPVSGATLQGLDIRRLKDYFAQVRQQPTPVEDDEEAWRRLLLNTEIMVEDGITIGCLVVC